MLKTRRNMSMTLKESLDNCTWKQKTKILRKNFSFWSVIRRLLEFYLQNAKVLLLQQIVFIP